MNVRVIRALVRRDLTVVLRARAVLIPIVLLPLIFYVVLPAGFGVGFWFAARLGGLKHLADGLPPEVFKNLGEYLPVERPVAFTFVVMMAPLFLIVPLAVSSVIAADSIAGERERKTLEALLYTPATDGELFTAKVLAAWIPAMSVAIGGFVLYSVVANAAAWPVMHRVFFPTPMWFALVFWLMPAVAAMGLAATVLVSSRVRTFQEAQQLGGLVVLPVILLVAGQVTGALFLHLGTVLLLGAVLWTLDAALLWFGGRTFKRGELVSRL